MKVLSGRLRFMVFLVFFILAALLGVALSLGGGYRVPELTDEQVNDWFRGSRSLSRTD